MAKPKQTTSKNFIIPIIPYEHDLMVSINETEEQFRAAFVPFGIELSNKKAAYMRPKPVSTGNYSARTSFVDGRLCICVGCEMSTCQQYGMLSHEIFHVVEMLMNKIGMPLGKKSSEAWAYCIQYLTMEIYKQL